MYLLKTDSWYLERVLYLLAGIMTLGSALLAWLHSIYWLILTILVGLNLIVLSTTGFCISAQFFRKLGVKPRIARNGDKRGPSR